MSGKEVYTRHMAFELLPLQQGGTVWVPEFQRNTTVTVTILCLNCDSNSVELVAIVHVYYLFPVTLKT